MGNIIASKCRICGFSNEFYYGGGKFSYLTCCPVPAINKETLEFENVNYFEHKDSGDYLFYHDDVLKGDNYENVTYLDFDLKLNKTNNYCPQCKVHTLDFRITMFTD